MTIRIGGWKRGAENKYPLVSVAKSKGMELRKSCNNDRICVCTKLRPADIAGVPVVRSPLGLEL